MAIQEDEHMKPLQEASPMHLVLFDFDGTLTLKDSLVDFVAYAVGKPAYYRGLLSLSSVLVAYKLKFISNHAAKEKFIAHFFQGWDSHHFQQIADRYAAEKIDAILRPKALERLHWHRQNGHKIVVVSASMECWLKKWCERHEIDLVATGLEIQDGKLTGKFATKNCYGAEKVNRIKARYNLLEYGVIYAYGDSAGDKDMLSLAHHAYYRHFPRQ